jgi:hypothetical protein
VASPSGIGLAISVAIHVAPDVAPELSAAAVHSCEAALGTGQCQLESDAPADFYAIVVFPADGASGADSTNAHVEIRRAANTPALGTRDVSFGAEDTPHERWASAGVLIAALVVSEARTETPPPPPRETPRPAPPKPNPVAAPSRWRIDGRGLVSRRTTRGGPEFGAAFGASVLPAHKPWFVGAAIAGAHRFDEEPNTSWLSASATAGLRAGAEDARFAAEFSAGPTVEYWDIGASDSTRSQHAGHLRVGGCLGVDALWAVHSRWILSLGVEGRWVAPRFRIDVLGSEVERVPSAGVLLYAGVRFIP